MRGDALSPSSSSAHNVIPMLIGSLAKISSRDTACSFMCVVGTRACVRALTRASHTRHQEHILSRYDQRIARVYHRAFMFAVKYSDCVGLNVIAADKCSTVVYAKWLESSDVMPDFEGEGEGGMRAFAWMCLFTCHPKHNIFKDLNVIFIFFILEFLKRFTID